MGRYGSKSRAKQEGASSTEKINEGNFMKTYILLRQDFKEQPPEVEGYFNSIKQAKKYIEENELCEDGCQLYELASKNNLL